MLAIAELIKTCKAAMDGKFSDIHIKEKEIPRVRTTNGLDPVGEIVMERQDILEFLEKRRPTLQFVDELEKSGGEFDFSFEFDGDNYRGNLAHYNGHQMIMLVMRKLDKNVRSLTELGLPLSLLKWLDNDSGIVFVAGATGAGKTSTLAAFVQHINETRAAHILTAEDPIEIRFQPVKSTITQREIGQDTKNFASAARAAMREDPDVILIGEIRDLPSAMEALRLAETGHLVLSTIHADSADGAIDRLARIFEGSVEQKLLLHSLATQLIGVVYQRLLVSKEVDANGLAKRVLAFESISNTPAIESLIRENKMVEIRNAILLAEKQENTIDLRDVLDSLLNRNLIDSATANKAVTRREKFFSQGAIA